MNIAGHLIFLLVFSVNALLSSSFLNAEVYDARVENLSNRKYFSRTLTSLNEAKKSILVGMYIITLGDSKKDSEIRQLLDALISAKKRGVDVKVIMEYHSGLDFTPKGMRNNAFRYLLENGISVNFDESAHRCAHLKAIVIDNEISIAGSSNWSNLALNTNDEINVLVHSKPLAEEFSKEILSIPLFPNSAPSLSTEKYFNIQPLMESKILDKIVSLQAERALDIILLLLYNGKDTIGFSFIANKLGIAKTMTRTDYRRQIIKVLKKIEKRYKPAEFDIKHGRDEIRITWLIPSDEHTVFFPKIYFGCKWNTILSMPGKSVLLALYTEFSGNEGTDIDISISSLAKKYKLKPDFFSGGLQELKHYNIVKVYYQKGFWDRKTTKINLRGLYDINIFENEIKELYKEFGKKNVEYARSLANIVYCKYDINVIKDILKQINSYGRYTVRRSFYITAKKNPDNPQRNYVYTRGIIRKNRSPI